MVSEHPSIAPGGRHKQTAPGAEFQPVRRAPGWVPDEQRFPSYRRTAPRPPAAPAAAYLTLLVGFVALCGQWDVYGPSAEAQNSANWALGFMIISTAGALRILVGSPGHHLPSVAAILISGVGFLVLAFLVTEDPSATYVFEITCGALLVLAGAMALASPQLTTDPQPPQPPG